MKGTDGKNHSVELRIFPESMRGLGEGQYAWDLMPDSLMTNATVSGIASAPQGQDLKVTYKGGASEIVVGPNTPIFGYLEHEPAKTRGGGIHRRREEARQQLPPPRMWRPRRTGSSRPCDVPRWLTLRRPS